MNSGEGPPKLVAATIALAACLAGAREARGEFGDPIRGQSLFVTKGCVQCHAVRGTGGRVGPDLGRTAVKGSFFELAAGMWNHSATMSRKMREARITRPSFRENELGDLIAFLYFLNYLQTAREFRSAGDPDRGRRVFASKGCARCHAIFGRGPSIGPDLGQSELRGSVTQLAGRMWNHWPAMTEAMGALGMSPPTFHGEEMADLFAYLFLSRYDGRPGDVARGEAVFRRRGCAACHGQRGQGNIGPALARITAGESKESIAQRMWNHAPQMGEKMTVYRVAWPRFGSDEMADLFAFLGSKRQAPPPAGHPPPTAR